MQKVVGSSPIIRFNKAPLDGVFCCLHLKRRKRYIVVCAHLRPFEGAIEGSHAASNEQFGHDGDGLVGCLAGIVANSDEKTTDRLEAARILLERGWGKAPIALDTDGQPTQFVLVSAFGPGLERDFGSIPGTQPPASLAKGHIETLTLQSPQFGGPVRGPQRAQRSNFCQFVAKACCQRPLDV